MAFVPEILRFESLPSTNLEAARRAMEGAAEGLCVIAREQTAGRGRSSAGGFRQRMQAFISALFFVHSLNKIPGRCLPNGGSCGERRFAGSLFLETDMWPNDILASEETLRHIGRNG